MQGVFLAFLREQLALQKDNFFLWCPVFLGLGIGLYFSLSVEPPLWIAFGIVILVSGVLALGYWLGSHHLRPLYFMKLAFVLIALGFTAAQVRTVLVAAPMLERKLAPVMVEGVVEAVEPLEEGSGRLVLKNVIIEDLDPAKTPTRVRLRLRPNMEVLVGQKIKGLAELNPPSGPVLPGGFDFRRHLFYAGIGAVGFFYKQPEILEQPRSYFKSGIERLRQSIGVRIERVLPEREAAVTLALMIGQQKALSEADMQAIRDAGLAHMLSISGLHITLLAGVLFFLCRLIMAIIPDFALKHPIKKYAAVFAMMGAVFYMLVAGSTAPTVRSVLMIGVIFLAIILDRSPISLRLVAFAALVILILAPENLISVSFQMSFAAVAALIAFFDSTRDFWARWGQKSGWGQKFLIYLSGVCLTTFIATLVTMPFSIFHFQQFAFMGVVANFIAVPLLSFLIMPFIVLGFFLMPLGLDFVPLMIVGFGVDLILQISHTAADLPGAVMRFAAIPFAAFVLCVMAGLWIILWKGWGKLCSTMFFIPAIFIAMTANLSDILVSETHKLMAFKVEGQLYVTTRKSDKFTRENWEKYYGLPKGSSILINQEGNPFSCDDAGCRLTIEDNKVAYIIDPYITAQECAWADIVLSVDPVDKTKCRAPVIVDKFDTWRAGSHALWIPKQGKIKQETSASRVGQRPWAKNLR